MNKISVNRWLYCHRYTDGTNYVYFNFTPRRSIGWYGWKKEDIEEFFNINIKPKENKKVKITIEEL